MGRRESERKTPDLHRRGLVALLLVGVALFLNRDMLFASMGYETREDQLRRDLNTARSVATRGDLEKGLEIAEGLLERFPRDLRVISFLLDVNLRAGHPRRTRDLALQALDQRPELHGFRLRLGEAQRQLGELEAASESLLEVLRHQPRNSWAHFYHGLLLEDSGKPAEAEGEYRHVLDRSPRFLRAQLQLGKLLEATGRETEARALYAASPLAEVRQLGRKGSPAAPENPPAPSGSERPR